MSQVHFLSLKPAAMTLILAGSTSAQ